MALTKVSYSMIDGAVANVLDFGAVGNGVADDTAAIQAALDAAPGVFFPAGTYKITAALQLNSYNFLSGVFQQSIISSTFNGPAIKGKGVTPASGTNVRRYYGGGSNLNIQGPGIASTSSIGLDMRGCTGFKWSNIIVQNFDTGVVQGEGYSTYYNEYRAVDIVDVNIGYYSTALGNENLVVGGRVASCTTGTVDSENSHNKYVGLAIEVFTSGHVISGLAAVGITYIASRLEGGTTGISVNSVAQDTQIISPYYQTVTTPVSDSGLRTCRFDALGAQFVGGNLVSNIFKQTINQAIGPIGAGAMAQIAFTLTPRAGAATSILPGDGVYVTLPQTWPATLMAGPAMAGGTNTIYLPVYNISGAPVSLGAADYVVTTIKAT